MRVKFLFVYAVIATCLLLPSRAEAQDDIDTTKRNLMYSLSASAGLNDFHMKDNYLSPDIFHGTFFSARIRFERRSMKSINEINAGVSPGAISSDLQPLLHASEIVGSISYSYERSMHTMNVGKGQLTSYLGLGLTSFVAATTRFDNIDTLTGYTLDDGAWYWSHSADILARFEYVLDTSRRLSVRFRLPAFRIVSRPENGHGKNPRNEDIADNNLKAATGGHPEFLWDNMVIDSEVEFRQSLSNRFALIADYLFSYVASDRPMSMLSMGEYMNNLTLGVSWEL